MESNWPLMIRQGPRVREADVADFENRLGIVLPDDYRRFLLEVNGGDPDEAFMRVSHLSINRLLSLEDKGQPSCDLEASADWAQHVLPHRDLLLIGYTDSGMLLLAHAGSHRGEVWSLDTVDPRPSGANPRVLWHDRRDIEKVADSFEEFMSKLGPVDHQVRAG
jgi:cell wall assembly regulator SMI1